MSRIHKTCYWHYVYGDEFETCVDCRRKLIDAEELFCFGAFSKDRGLPRISHCNSYCGSCCCRPYFRLCRHCEWAWAEIFSRLQPDRDGMCKRLLPEDVTPGELGILYHEGYVVAYRITKDDADAHDAVQTAFFKIHRMPNSPQQLRSLFLVAVKRAAIDIVRRRKRHLPIQEQWLPDRNGNREELFIEEDLNLSAAMEELPLSDQRILRMHYIKGLSHEEIAERLGVPVTTVNNRLAKARSRLREVLMEPVGT